MLGPRIAMFESWRGRYTDSPRAISQLLAEVRPDIRQVWVADPATEFPDGVRRVRRHSAEYFALLEANTLLVANDIITKHIVKGPRSTYLQTWHGTPLKLIGHDEYLNGYIGAASHLKRVIRDVARWDYLVSPSPTCTELFRSAFRYDGPVLEVGYPRNDLLRSPQAAQLRTDTRAELGLSEHDMVVLYMPTWRDDVRDPQGRLAMPTLLDFSQLARTAPSNTVILSRMHRNIAVPAVAPSLDQPGPSGRGLRVVDCSSHPEVNHLYLAADVLVSDYSSAVYDFAVTGKPVLLLAPDLARYADQVRGFYFDYASWAPGPVLTDTAGLAAALWDLDVVTGEYATRYAAFVQVFCPFEDGAAAARVLDALDEHLG